MKRYLSLFLAVCLVPGLCACGSDTPASGTAEGSTSSSEETVSSADPSESTGETGPQETYPLIAEQDDLDAIVASSENFSFTKGELAYFFAMVFKDYYSYFSTYGVDPEVSLKEQQFSETQTWFDLFLEQAMRYPTSYLTFCEAAKDRGITLKQEDLDYIASQKKQIETEAANYSWTADTYLEQMFGTNITWEILESALNKMLLADRGYAAFTAELEEKVSEDDVKARLEEDPKLYQYVDLVQLDFLYAEGMTDEDKTELREAFNKATDEASFKKAVVLYVEKAAEQEKIDEAGSAEAYAEQLIADNTSLKQPYKNSALMDWIFGDERSGDVFVEPDEMAGKQYAYLVLTDPYFDEDTYVNVRHILALTETYGTIEAAHAKAEEIYESWKSGEKTEDSFANLAIEFSEDGGSASNGGLCENVYRGQMVEPFENWCFDEERVPGDTGIVDTSYGAHVMYFVDSSIGWDLQVRSDILDELYAEAYKQLTDKHPVTSHDDIAESINW